MVFLSFSFAKIYIIRRLQSNAIIFYVIMEDTVDARELKLKHPFSMLLSGARRTGKTFFVTRLLSRNREFITPAIDWVFWFAPSRQDALINELEKNLDGHFTFVNGLPENEDVIDHVRVRGGRKLIVLDDVMEEASKRSDIKHLFTRGRHEDVSVIFLSQNAFHRGAHFREMSLNSDYFVIFKNVRDASTITTIGKQMKLTKFLPWAYKQATAESYSYLFCDMRTDTNEKLRFRGDIFARYPIVYVPDERDGEKNRT